MVNPDMWQKNQLRAIPITTIIVFGLIGCFNTDLPERFQADDPLADTSTPGTDTATETETATDSNSDSTGSTDPSRDTAYCDTADCWSPQPTGILACFDQSGSIDCDTSGPICQYDSDVQVDTDTFYPSAYFCGQDGEYNLYTGRDQSFSPIYNTADTDNSDKMMQDNQTGFVWSPQNHGLMEWQDAWDECDGLDYGGHKDWSLPTYHQLATLVDYGETSNPMIHSSFGAFPSGWHWVVEKYLGNPYIIKFEEGTIAPDFIAEIDTETDTYLGPPTRAFVCVRNAQNFGSPNARFTDKGDYYIDRATGLWWESSYKLGGSWPDALTHCQNQTMANRNDWRLPSINELRELISLDLTDPATRFPGTPSQHFWSSTPSAVYSGVPASFFEGATLAVFFEEGSTNWVPMHGFNDGHPAEWDDPYTRCVRTPASN